MRDNAREIITPINDTGIGQSIITHELNTPLNSIIGFSDLIIEEDSLFDIKQFANIIKENGSQLLDKIRSITDAGLYSNSNSLSLNYVEFNNIVRDIVAKLTNDTEFSRDKAVVYINNDISSNKILTDIRILERILLSLIKCLLNNSIYNKIFLSSHVVKTAVDQKGLVLCISKNQHVTADECKVVINENKSYCKRNFKYCEGFGVEMAICDILSNKIDSKIFLHSSENDQSIFCLFPISNMFSSCHNSMNSDKVIIVEENDQSYFEIKKSLDYYPFFFLRISEDILEETIKTVSGVRIVIISNIKEESAYDQIQNLVNMHDNILFILQFEPYQFPEHFRSSRINLQVLFKPISNAELEEIIDGYFEKQFWIKK